MFQDHVTLIAKPDKDIIRRNKTQKLQATVPDEYSYRNISTKYQLTESIITLEGSYIMVRWDLSLDKDGSIYGNQET